MKKQNIFLLLGVGLLVLTFVLGNFFNKEEESLPKEEIESPTLYTGQIILLIKGNDIIMGSSTPQYPTFKKAIEDVVFNIQGPAYPGSIFPEEGEGEEGQFSINSLKSEAIGVSTFLMDAVELTTNLDYPTEEIHSIRKSDQGKTKIISDQLFIVLGGKYKGTIFTRDNFESKKWTAWQGDPEKIKNLVGLMQQEW